MIAKRSTGMRGVPPRPNAVPTRPGPPKNEEARRRLRAYRASEEAWSHGSAPRRGHPQRDNLRPIRVASQPRSLGGPLTSAAAPSRRFSGSSILRDGPWRPHLLPATRYVVVGGIVAQSGGAEQRARAVAAVDLPRMPLTGHGRRRGAP